MHVAGMTKAATRNFTASTILSLFPVTGLVEGGMEDTILSSNLDPTSSSSKLENTSLSSKLD